MPNKITKADKKLAEKISQDLANNAELQRIFNPPRYGLPKAMGEQTPKPTLPRVKQHKSLPGQQELF